MKMRHTLAMCAVACASVMHANAQVAAPAGSVANGRASFQKNMCFTCHGTVGQGGERGAGPRIAPNAWPYEAFVQQVRRPREGMPRYSARFVSDQELADIYAYVASIKAGSPAKDIALLAITP